MDTHHSAFETDLSAGQGGGFRQRSDIAAPSNAIEFHDERRNPSDISVSVDSRKFPGIRSPSLRQPAVVYQQDNDKRLNSEFPSNTEAMCHYSCNFHRDETCRQTPKPHYATHCCGISHSSPIPLVGPVVRLSHSTSQTKMDGRVPPLEQESVNVYLQWPDVPYGYNQHLRWVSNNHQHQAPFAWYGQTQTGPLSTSSCDTGNITTTRQTESSPQLQIIPPTTDPPSLRQTRNGSQGRGTLRSNRRDRARPSRPTIRMSKTQSDLYRSKPIRQPGPFVDDTFMSLDDYLQDGETWVSDATLAQQRTPEVATNVSVAFLSNAGYPRSGLPLNDYLNQQAHHSASDLSEPLSPLTTTHNFQEPESVHQHWNNSQYFPESLAELESQYSTPPTLDMGSSQSNMTIQPLQQKFPQAPFNFNDPISSDYYVSDNYPLPTVPLPSNDHSDLTAKTTNNIPGKGRNGNRNADLDRKLVEWRNAGLSYREIMKKGNWGLEESTLRGRYRTLTKPKDKRLRKPVWKQSDIDALLEAVDAEAPPSARNPHVKEALDKVPWKKVAQWMADNRGCYHFGNATVKKKYHEVRNAERAARGLPPV